MSSRSDIDDYNYFDDHIEEHFYYDEPDYVDYLLDYIEEYFEECHYKMFGYYYNPEDFYEKEYYEVFENDNFEDDDDFFDDHQATT